MADIIFEEITPFVEGQGDNGKTAREKIKRNFDKVKGKIADVESDVGKLQGDVRDLKETVGKDDATFSFPSSETTYNWRYIDYNFINGHRYKIHIEDDSAYTNYFSVRDNSGNALQNEIGGRSSGTRDIEFKCEVSGGTRWAMTLVEAHDAQTYDCYIIDLDDVTTYAHDERLLSLESDMSEIHAQNLPKMLDVGETANVGTITFSKTGSYIDKDGEVQEDSSLLWSTSNIIQLRKNDTVRMTCSATTSNRPYVIKTDSESSYYEALVLSKLTQQMEEVSYTATEDCYILLQYYRIDVLPVVYADSARLVGIESELKTIDGANNDTLSLVRNIEGVIALEHHDDERSITINERQEGGRLILNDGSVTTSKYWFFSDVIHLYKNEKVSLTCFVTSSNYSVIIAVTDQQESFFKPVLFGTAYSNDTMEPYSYTATEDCYIIIQYRGKRGEITITPDSGRIVELEKEVKEIYGNIGSLLNILPEYAIHEEDRVYGELLSNVNTDNVFIAFNTDQHFDLDASPSHKYNPSWVMNGIRALHNIASRIPLDLIVFGGDTPGYGGGTSNQVDGIIKTCNYLFEPLTDINVPIVSIPGNHDAYQNNGNITANAMYNVHYKRFKCLNSTRVHSGYKYDCDSYIDDVEHGIRYIFIDTYSGYVMAGVDYDAYVARINRTGAFLESALSSMPQGYNAIVFSHNPLTNEFSDIKKINSQNNEVDAFANPTNYKSILDTYASSIIACICGHSHADVYAFSQSGILFIETTCAAAHARDKYFDENVDNDVPMPYEATINTVTDTAFDFFVIDLVNKTIEAIRYGQGCNRKWKYKGDGAGLISYTNHIAIRCNIGNVGFRFVDINDGSNIVGADVDGNGQGECYLQLGKTYYISCSGYTVDTSMIEIEGNTELELELMANI